MDSSDAETVQDLEVQNEPILTQRLLHQEDMVIEASAFLTFWDLDNTC